MSRGQLFRLETIVYHYNELKKRYITSTSKSIPLLKILKTVSHKGGYIVAMKLFDRLPNELKLIKGNNNYSKNILKT